MKWMYNSLFVFFCILWHSSQATSISLGEGSDYYPVSEGSILVIKDTSGKYTLTELLESGIFFPTSKPLNETKDAYYWIKLSLTGIPESKKKYVFELCNYEIDLIEFYRPVNEMDYERVLTGTQTPFKNREYQHINFVFDLNLDYAGSRDYYFRIKSKKPVFWEASIKTQDVFSQHLIMKYASFGLYYGFLCLVFLYVLFLLLTKRGLVQLLFIPLLVSTALVSMVRDGSGFAYVWNNNALLTEFLNYTAPTVLILFFVLFARQFLSFPLLLKKLDQFLIGSLVVYLLFSTSVFSAPIPTTALTTLATIEGVLYALPYLIILIGAVLSWEKKHTNAKWFTLGFLAIGVCFGTKTLAQQGLQTHTFLGDLLLDNILKTGIVLFIGLQMKGISEASATRLQQSKKTFDTGAPADETGIKNLQTKLLPSKEQLIKALGEYFVFYKPKASVSENFYFVHSVEDKVFMAVASVKGDNFEKGIFSVLLHQTLHDLVVSQPLFLPEEILSGVRARLLTYAQHMGSELQIAAYLLDRTTLQLQVGSNGIYALIVSGETHRVIPSKENDFFASTDFAISSFTLEKGDKLFFYTQGIPDIKQVETGDIYSNEKTISLIRATSEHKFGEQFKEIKQALEEWQGAQAPTEDILLIGLKI